jgi:hypothetical protein
MLLKLGLFPVYLLGGLLALLRVDVPYIPTPKTAQAGRFFRLAWPALLLLSLTAALAVRQAWYRLHVLPEAQLLVTAGVAWGMIGFALVNATHACAVVVAAWQAARGKGGGS